MGLFIADDQHQSAPAPGPGDASPSPELLPAPPWFAGAWERASIEADLGSMSPLRVRVGQPFAASGVLTVSRERLLTALEPSFFTVPVRDFTRSCIVRADNHPLPQGE